MNQIVLTKDNIGQVSGHVREVMGLGYENFSKLMKANGFNKSDTWYQLLETTGYITPRMFAPYAMALKLVSYSKLIGFNEQLVIKL